MNRFRLPALGGLAAALCAAVLAAAPAAFAHPLGNFTINHYNGLSLHPDRIENTLVVDSAEIAAAQERPRVDSNGDGTVGGRERAAYARERCAERADALALTVNRKKLHWTVGSSTFAYQPGEAGLKTSRLQCKLAAVADLRQPAAVQVEDTYDSKRIGWHEMTAGGHGVALEDSPLPTTSVTHALRDYPDDLLASPLDQRHAAFRTTPGDAKDPTALALPDLPGAGPVTTAFERVGEAFNSLVGTRELTLPVGILALLLAMVLGASHAALPGHGKTIMAAYLAGRRGRARDAVTVGATVTLTHTAGVLVLGLLLPVATSLAGETVLTWLGLASGLLVTAIGIGLLRGALRKDSSGHHHHHHHGGGHSHHHGDHGHSHEHRYVHAHSHGTLRGLLLRSRRPAPSQGPPAHPAAEPGGLAVLTEETEHQPTADPLPAPHEPLPPVTPAPRPTRRVLVGLGIAGGLVPSPSALIVLLGAVALGRTPFGILLVFGYGTGMAATLTAAGLLLIRFRDRLSHAVRHRATGYLRLLKPVARFGPVITATLVLIVGLGLTARALTGT